MLYNILDSTVKRNISTCNFNQHIRTTHPDRIMDEHDLIYIKEGAWSICQDGVEYKLTPGDIILLQSGHHHYGITPCESIVKTCFVHFNCCSNDIVTESNKNGSDTWSFPMVVHCKGNPMAENCFNRIIYSYWSDDEYAKRKASAYLDLLLCEISSAEKTNTATSLAEDIKHRIKTTPNRFIGNEEFAKEYHCSVRTISNKFKENTGYSLHAWQMRLKCRMADELMQYDPSLTLKEIAATYGFYDEYHFGKCYKKIYGCSPRKNVKKQVCSVSPRD